MDTRFVSVGDTGKVSVRDTMWCRWKTQEGGLVRDTRFVFSWGHRNRNRKYQEGKNISLTHRRSVSKIHHVCVRCQQETPGDVSVGKTRLVSVENASSRRDVNKRQPVKS